MQIDKLNERAHIAGDSGVNIDTLKTITGPPTLFEALRGTDATPAMSEEQWQEISGPQSKETNNRFQKNKKKKAAWIEAEMAPTDLQPRADNDVYWFPVDLAHDTELVCVECRSNTKTEKHVQGELSQLHQLLRQ